MFIMFRFSVIFPPKNVKTKIQSNCFELLVCARPMTSLSIEIIQKKLYGLLYCHLYFFHRTFTTSCMERRRMYHFWCSRDLYSATH